MPQKHLNKVNPIPCIKMYYHFLYFKKSAILQSLISHILGITEKKFHFAYLFTRLIVMNNLIC